MSLDDIASEMKKRGNNAYNYDDEQVQNALDTLANQFDTTSREKLRDIMVNDEMPEGADTISEAVKVVTSDNDIKSTFSDEWDNEVLRDIQYDLKEEYNQVWADATDEISMIKDMFIDANISELNEMCASFDFQDVYDELGSPDDFDAPDTYAECTSMVARVQDIKSDLTTAYQP